MTYHATSFGNITGADIARLPGAYKCRARACHLLIAQFFSSLTLSLSLFLPLNTLSISFSFSPLP